MAPHWQVVIERSWDSSIGLPLLSLSWLWQLLKLPNDAKEQSLTIPYLFATVRWCKRGEALMSRTYYDVVRWYHNEQLSETASSAGPLTTRHRDP